MASTDLTRTHTVATADERKKHTFSAWIKRGTISSTQYVWGYYSDGNNRIEIGFHSEEAFTIASQTARGAATLLLDNSAHPESEIDRVTTPKGATIAGLNEMEHQGFSSAMVRGVIASYEKIEKH